MDDPVDEQKAAAELQSFQGALNADRLLPAENLAFNLISFFLTRKAVGFRNLVIAEMCRRIPNSSPNLLEAGYDKAYEYWTECYCG